MDNHLKSLNGASGPRELTHYSRGTQGPVIYHAAPGSIGAKYRESVSAAAIQLSGRKPRPGGLARWRLGCKTMFASRSSGSSLFVRHQHILSLLFQGRSIRTFFVIPFSVPSVPETWRLPAGRSAQSPLHLAATLGNTCE